MFYLAYAYLDIFRSYTYFVSVIYAFKFLALRQGFTQATSKARVKNKK